MKFTKQQLKSMIQEIFDPPTAEEDALYDQGMQDGFEDKSQDTAAGQGYYAGYEAGKLAAEDPESEAAKEYEEKFGRIGESSMRVTKRQLRRIVKEEKEALRTEMLLRQWIRENLNRSDGRLDEGFFDKLKDAGAKLMSMFKGDPVKAAGKVLKTQRDAFKGLDEVIKNVENAKRADDLEKLFPGDAEFKKVLDLAVRGGYSRPAQAKLELQAAIIHAFLRSDAVAKAFRNAAGQAGYYEKSPDREAKIANAITGGDNEAMQDSKVKKIAARLAEDFDDAIKEYGDPAASVGDYTKRMKGASRIRMAARESVDNVLENIQ